ncbi:COX15/CtaA family protein [Streptomyces sp. SID3343]|uniref:COX15/CtaA family protein n=1 Tax=Streptomyces sp. SID3343 TaxID=2690260 RepID=UPI001368EB2B|nr:COX15/CtaA family protein [Streptomyces sp. SID3343]MYW05969.1 heme A synthase [Streptomyces sp. SID3343]
MSLQAVSPLARRVFLVNLVAQIGIVITGGLVRLTDSGLGCDTWPRCNNTDWTPHDAVSHHAYIEFGNRMLTYVVGAIAVVCVVFAYRHRPRRKDVVVLAWIQIGTVVGQAVLGGITVLTDLHPMAVASHLLLSMLLIASAVVLYERAGEGDAPARLLVRPEIRWFGYGTLVVAAGLIVMGTVVTGSGPHSGDLKSKRFDVDIDQMAWLHADLAFVLLGAAVALALALRVTDAPLAAQRRVWWLLGVLVPQGLIGYIQYFNGLPEWQVLIHMFGATLTVVTATRVLFALRVREDAVGTPTGDAAHATSDREPVATSY